MLRAVSSNGGQSAENTFTGDNTGATDVGAAINAFAAAHDGLVILPAGEFLIETPIDPGATNHNLFLKGQGVGLTTIKYSYDVKDDSGNVCAAISYNGKLGSGGYDTTSGYIGDSQTAVVPINKTITGISSSASTPTVTVSAAHGLASGVFVYISGVTCSVGTIADGMYMAILDSSTSTTTFRLHDINGAVVDTSGITYTSGGTVDCYFNRYSALTVNAANGDYLFACDVADASGYSAGDFVHIHSQDDYLIALAEGRHTGESNTIVFADHSANRLYFQKPIAFAHLYHASPLVTRYKGTQKVIIEGISFTNDAASGDPLDTPFAIDSGSNTSSAIDIIGVVRPIVRNCDFSRCWGTAVRFINCPNFLHLNNDTDVLYNADVYNNVVEKVISNITSATPPVVTTTATHSISNGNPVVIRNVVGTTEANNKVFQARNVNAGAKTFELYDMNGNPVNGSAWTAYISGGNASIANVRRLGYGVSAYGASSGVVSGGVYRNGRHPFTTDGKTGTYAANKWFLWGQPTNVLIENVTAIDPWGPAFDTHEEGRFITFKNCAASYATRSPDATDTYSVGMLGQVRCLNVVFEGCSFFGGKQQIRLANTSHSLQPKTDFINCSFKDTSIIETSSGNKEGAIIIDSSEATTNPYWPNAYAYNCVFDNVGAAVYMSGVSAVNVNSKAKFYNCTLTRITTVADCGAGSKFEMHGGSIDYSGLSKIALRRRAVAYCSKLRDDATAAVAGSAIFNNVTIIRGETTNQPAAIFERTSNNGISKYYWARNCTILNPSNLSGILPMLSAKTNMVEATYLLDNTDVRNINNTAVGNVGTGEDNLITYALPANTLYGAGRGVKITAWGTGANNANAKTLKMYFGTQLMATLSMTTSQANNWRAVASVVSTGDDTQDYEAQITQFGTVTQLIGGNGSATQDDGGNITIKCTGEATTNNDIVMEGLIVELI